VTEIFDEISDASLFLITGFGYFALPSTIDEILSLARYLSILHQFGGENTNGEGAVGSREHDQLENLS
jgi:hypothetical protein